MFAKSAWPPSCMRQHLAYLDIQVRAGTKGCG